MVWAQNKQREPRQCYKKQNVGEEDDISTNHNNLPPFTLAMPSLDELKSKANEILEGKIDFEGQNKVEYIVRIWMTAATILSFVIGFALQSLKATFGAFSLSVILLSVLVVPPWGAYNRHPVQWLPLKSQTEKEKSK
ncbi:SPCS1 family protein [Abortiporus biennis]